MILKLTTFPRKIKGLVAALHLIRNIKLAIKPRLLFIAIPTKPRLILATIFVNFILQCVLQYRKTPQNISTIFCLEPPCTSINTIQIQK